MHLKGFDPASEKLYVRGIEIVDLGGGSFVPKYPIGFWDERGGAESTPARWIDACRVFKSHGEAVAAVAAAIDDEEERRLAGGVAPFTEAATPERLDRLRAAGVDVIVYAPGCVGLRFNVDYVGNRHPASRDAWDAVRGTYGTVDAAVDAAIGALDIDESYRRRDAADAADAANGAAVRAVESAGREGDASSLRPSDVYDPVECPAHYTAGGIECIDAIRAALGRDGYAAFLRGQVIKYQWRMGLKGDAAEDAGKARWYAARLEAFLKEESGGR